MPGDFWSADDVSALRRLWDDGLSCTQIAAALGNGYTRCAVAGKARREKLKPRPSTMNRGHGGRRVAGVNNKPKPVVALDNTGPKEPTPLPPDEVGANPVSLINAKDEHCRWPMQPIDGESFVCGDKKEKGPYCAAHWKQGHQPKTEKAEAEAAE